MKKLLLPLLLGASLTAFADGNTLNVRGRVYQVDTLFHAVVGPGTTQTSLRLTSDAYPQMVHYLTVDLTKPGVSVRAVCARDKIAGTATTSSMAASKTKPGLDYFCGVNADFFSTSGTAANGNSWVGRPTTSCTVDGEIYKTSNSNYQFSVDTEGVPRICRLNYYTGTATIGEKVTLFKGVNVASPNNGITIYTPRYIGDPDGGDYADNCWQVTAKLAPGSQPFKAGGKFSLEVTSAPDASGRLAIPSDGYVIHGRGTSKTDCNTGAKNFVGALKVGDIVEFDNIILTPEGDRITPYTIVSGNPKNVGGGETLDTEAERGDAKDRHPRTNIGFSADGKKLIMMVIDGRATGMSGVSTSMAADIMRYAGADESVNLDGGGSSTLYTHALGVRNHCSDGNERAVGNAVFAVLEAPEDKAIAEIRFSDFRKDMPLYGSYTPVIYGYNKHGLLVDKNVKGFTLSMDESRVSDDGMTVTGLKAGSYALKATKDGMTSSIVVTVKPLESAPKIALAELLIDDHRTYLTEVTAKIGDDEMAMDNAAFTWGSDNTSVATVSDNGLIAGVANGTATITAANGELSSTLPVTVEIPTKRWTTVDPERNVENYSPTKSGLSALTVSKPSDEALALTYKVSSTRATKAGVKLSAQLYSCPDSIRLVINPGDATIKSVILDCGPKSERSTSKTYTPTLIANTNNVLLVPVSDFCDPKAADAYPFVLNTLSFMLGDAVSAERTITINALQSVHTALDPSTNGVDEIQRDPSDANARWFDLQGRPVDENAPGLQVSRKAKRINK